MTHDLPSDFTKEQKVLFGKERLAKPVPPEVIAMHRRMGLDLPDGATEDDVIKALLSLPFPELFTASDSILPPKGKR